VTINWDMLQAVGLLVCWCVVVGGVMALILTAIDKKGG